jgi:protein O-mannosyl-transferase
LIAGRAIWFYAGKLVWPAKLAFIYPKWTIDRRDLVQWLYPIAAVAVVAVLAAIRKRGALIAVLFFIGTLFPALGFFNIYPMRYSFVADHFQYLASVGLIVLFAAAVGRHWLSAIVLIPLAILTFRQAGFYRDSETLWRRTAQLNPNSWMVHTNLGRALAAENKTDPAIREFELALQCDDTIPETHWNVGIARNMQGHPDAAMREFDRAIEIDPKFADAYVSRGNVYLDRKDFASAKNEYQRAIEVNPDLAKAHFNLGIVHEQQNDLDGAIAEYEKTLKADPTFTKARDNLAKCLTRRALRQ